MVDMLLTKLREEVLNANLELVRKGLVHSTFGNVSGISREQGLVVIKPSGVRYDAMKPDDMVVTDLQGALVEGTLKPSSDLATHVRLYRAFPAIGGVAHTHSEFATAWAQAGQAIPCFGTTHADHFHGPIPVTAPLTPKEIQGLYEANTGEAIVRTFKKRDPMAVPAVLVANHAPFTWGADAVDAVENSWMLETIARMAYYTRCLHPKARPVGKSLLDRHYLRKHGKNAYYGQTRTKA
jgi:L-ribulose-5-phosphate 4-epimerase